ncbi:MAG: hypothetical protein LBK94_09420 [Prevotellaceae bacterium]|nr:hypothetical protein [Prevotellaceae bacterium]
MESTSFGGGRINRTGTNAYDVNYFITDHLGSTRVIVDNNGIIKEQKDFYPFGKEHENPDLITSTNRYTFSGKEKQVVGGVNFLDFSNRMYDDFICRWTTQDPLQEKFYSWSSYNYCMGNPVKLIDPDGQQPFFFFGYTPPIVMGTNPVVMGTSNPILLGTKPVTTGTVSQTARIINQAGKGVTRHGPTVEAAKNQSQRINFERINAGKQAETEQLQKLGLEKNTESFTRIDTKTGKEATTIPDAIKNGKIVEIKNLETGKTQSLTRQLRIQKEISNSNGEKPQLHINKEANLSKPLQNADFEITNYNVTSPIGIQDNTKINISIVTSPPTN